MVDHEDLSDEEIQRLADEAERGYSDESLKLRSIIASETSDIELFPLELETQMKSAIEERARKDAVNAGEVIRQAIRAYLDVA